MSKFSKAGLPKGIEPDEAYIKTPSGEYMVFESSEGNPAGTTYIRFVDSDGKETVYWDVEEWERSGAEVMGAICGCLFSGGTKLKRNTLF